MINVQPQEYETYQEWIINTKTRWCSFVVQRYFYDDGVVLEEIQAPSFDGTKIGFVDDDNFAKSYGYAPRYSEYKTNYDKYNGDFCFTLDLS